MTYTEQFNTAYFLKEAGGEQILKLLARGGARSLGKTKPEGFKGIMSSAVGGARGRMAGYAKGNELKQLLPGKSPLEKAQQLVAKNPSATAQYAQAPSTIDTAGGIAGPVRDFLRGQGSAKLQNIPLRMRRNELAKFFKQQKNRQALGGGIPNPTTSQQATALRSPSLQRPMSLDNPAKGDPVLRNTQTGFKPGVSAGQAPKRGPQDIAPINWNVGPDPALAKARTNMFRNRNVEGNINLADEGINIRPQPRQKPKDNPYRASRIQPVPTRKPVKKKAPKKNAQRNQQNQGGKNNQQNQGGKGNQNPAQKAMKQNAGRKTGF